MWFSIFTTPPSTKVMTLKGVHGSQYTNSWLCQQISSHYWRVEGRSLGVGGLIFGKWPPLPTQEQLRKQWQPFGWTYFDLTLDSACSHDIVLVFLLVTKHESSSCEMDKLSYDPRDHPIWKRPYIHLSCGHIEFLGLFRSYFWMISEYLSGHHFPWWTYCPKDKHPSLRAILLCRHHKMCVHMV